MEKFKSYFPDGEQQGHVLEHQVFQVFDTTTSREYEVDYLVTQQEGQEIHEVHCNAEVVNDQGDRAVVNMGAMALSRESAISGLSGRGTVREQVAEHFR